MRDFFTIAGIVPVSFGAMFDSNDVRHVSLKYFMWRHLSRFNYTRYTRPGSFIFIPDGISTIDSFPHQY